MTQKKKRATRLPATKGKAPVRLPASLLDDVRGIIVQARQDVARSVNSTLVLLYWQVGRRIREDILKRKRAEYGERILPALSAKLTSEFGRGYSDKNLRRMLQFAERFPEQQIVATLSRQLGWSHFKELIPFDDDLKRDFYAEMCRIEKWSVRALRQKVGGMLYERTALAKKPEHVIRHELDTLREEDQLTPDLVFKDPYFLDFLQLNDRYLERDVEDAILRQMEQFILELGVGFSFVARQKRIQVDEDDFYLDLLFFHRKLRRLVAIELKLDKFKPAHKGQMELYLRWLDENERHPGEEAPVGLILCATKSDEQIRLLRLDHGNIRVAAYMTELPPRKLLEEKLHEAVQIARQRVGEKNETTTRKITKATPRKGGGE